MKRTNAVGSAIRKAAEACSEALETWEHAKPELAKAVFEAGHRDLISFRRAIHAALQECGSKVHLTGKDILSLFQRVGGKRTQNPAEAELVRRIRGRCSIDRV
ncbi:hypothetical protein VT84_08875 [Gemmata sp. SH-PL17]|nr:hypothetical protein VT84_08875 [Gemmata sp. SH-PL17]